MNGTGLLNIKLDLEHWQGMSEQERSEHTFWCLSYLVEEAQKSKAKERVLTFAGSLVASLVTLTPTLWLIFTVIKKTGG